MGPPLQAADRQAEFPAQLVEVAAAAVPQFPALEEIPDALVGVQLGRVAGQSLRTQPVSGAGGEEVLDGLTVMDRCTVPDHQQLPAHLPQELAEEGNDRRAAERLLANGALLMPHGVPRPSRLHKSTQ